MGGAALWAYRGDSAYRDAEKSVNGFIEVAMADGAQPDTVFIFAPPNCPSLQAERARELERGLKARGIPATITSHYSLRYTETSDELQARIKRTMAVLDAPARDAPPVFVNGMGKRNPTLEEVAAEYERTTRGK